MLYFALSQAVFGKFELDSWVVEGGEFVVHSLHDFEAFGKVLDSVLCAPKGGS